MPSAETPHVEPASLAEWRGWLEANHGTSGGVWLVMQRAGDGRRPPVTYEPAVEEALCFGWVDSTGGKVDDTRTKLYFAPRKPRSGWAATNKARVERLIADGRMAPAGLRAIELAKANGYWTVLDGPTRGDVPEDLASALAARPPARETWDAYPASLRRALLEQLALARRPGTRAKRIDAIAVSAARGERPA
jgi:uncharacterized protein YdeI (YjbR/CyaY-like superfamily)